MSSTHMPPDGDVRRYQRVAALLREQMHAGQLAGGQQLPGELALAEEFGVSRITVRHALAMLRQEGLIVSQRGRGSFVRTPRVRQTLARLETLDASIAEQGFVSSTRILDFRFGQPDANVRAALALAADAEVLIVERVHFVADEPLALVEITLPAAIGSHFSRRDLEAHRLYELLPARLGITIGLATQIVRAESATADAARTLRVTAGTPVLTCERITFTDTGTPINHTRFLYRADRFEFRLSLSPSEGHIPWIPPGFIMPSGRGETERDVPATTPPDAAGEQALSSDGRDRRSSQPEGTDT